MGIRDFIEVSQDEYSYSEDKSSKELKFIRGEIEFGEDEDGFSLNLNNLRRIERLKSYIKRRQKK